jgi:hypothetical protein
VREQQRAGGGIDDIIMPVLRMVDGVLPGRRRPALEGEELLDGPVVVEERIAGTAAPPASDPR